jgi:hypothetical protein
MKLEVTMAEIQGDGAEGTRGVIDQISQIGRSAIARSIDCNPSRRLTPAEATGIERGGGRGDAVARARVRGGREVNATSAWSV